MITTKWNLTGSISGDQKLAGEINRAVEYITPSTSDLNYEKLKNKPSINGVELLGNKTSSDLGIENYDDTELRAEIAGKQPVGNYLTEEADPTVASYIKAITQNDISNWNNKSDFSGSYNDATDKPSINGVTLLGNKTAEQLGITSSLCNLGKVEDYNENNRLDLNKLSPGIYWLYRTYYSSPLYLKATYKGNEILGQWNAGEFNSRQFVLLEIKKEITDDLAERNTIGSLTYFKLLTSEIKTKSNSVQISSSEINTNTASEITMSPVDLSNSQTITGEKTFSTLPKSSVVPSDNAHFTNKAYVDSAISTAISQITDGDEVSY